MMKKLRYRTSTMVTALILAFVMAMSPMLVFAQTLCPEL